MQILSLQGDGALLPTSNSVLGIVMSFQRAQCGKGKKSHFATEKSDKQSFSQVIDLGRCMSCSQATRTEQGHEPRPPTQESVLTATLPGVYL